MKRALESFTGHSKTSCADGKKYTGSFLVSGLFVLCAICLPFSPCSTVLLILLLGPGQDPNWSLNLVFFKTNGAWEDPLYSRYNRNSSNYGKGMALFTVYTVYTVRIRPFERIVIYLARACFFEKQKSVFWLLGVLIKLSFPSCIAHHMSYLLFLNECYLQKIGVDAIFVIRFFKPSFLWSFTPIFSASNRDVSQDKCYNLYLFANRPAIKEIWHPRHTPNVRYEAVFLSTCI